MRRPPQINKGDKVGIVAPAKKISKEEIKIAIQILESWGLEVVLGDYLFNTYNQFAGTDIERTEDLQKMLDDPEIKVVICARGGYGTIRIVDKLDFSKFQSNPKWIIGFSDITVLHCHIYNLGIESIHGVMPLLFPKQTQQTIESLKNILEDKAITIYSPSHHLNRFGNAKGELIGGNLSLFVNTIGTLSEVDTTGKILFLEDVGEYVYHLDRMLIHLQRAGKLNHLVGLVIGQFSEIKENIISFGKTVYEIILELSQEFNFPIAYNFPIGHERHNLALVCGREALLEVDKDNAVLSF